MPNAQTLVARLVELRSPGRMPSEEERQRYARLPERQLERMIAALERGAMMAKATRTVAPGDAEARDAIRRRKEKALSDLGAVADRIAARKKFPALIQAQEVANPGKVTSVLPLDSEVHFNAILELLKHKPRENAISWSMRLRSVFEEFSDAWQQMRAPNCYDMVIGLEAGGMFKAFDADRSQYDTAAATKVHGIERYLDFSFQKTRRSALRLLVKELVMGAAKDRSLRNAISEYDRIEVFEPKFLEGAAPVLSPTGATEALAKICLFGREFQPTRIVSIGSGGEMVGDFLRCEMRIDHRFVRHWDDIPTVSHELPSAVSADDRILIVSDVASAPHELDLLRGAFAPEIPATSIAFAALAGSAETYETLRSNHLACIVNLTAYADVTMPWGGGGSYHRTSGSHFFGHSGSNPLRIAKDYFEFVTSDILHLFARP